MYKGKSIKYKSNLTGRKLDQISFNCSRLVPASNTLTDYLLHAKMVVMPYAASLSLDLPAYLPSLVRSYHVYKFDLNFVGNFIEDSLA